MDSKLRWFSLMEKEIAFDIISLLFVVCFNMGFCYCIEHLLFNISIKNFPLIHKIS